MSDELREKVYQLYLTKWRISDQPLAAAAIALARDATLEEAAVVFSRYKDDPFAASTVADHLRAMKEFDSGEQAS